MKTMCKIFYFSPPAAVRSTGVVLLGLVIVCFCFESLFCLQYFESFLVLQSSHWGSESWLLYFCCVLYVMPLLSFLATPSVRLQYVIGAFPGHNRFLSSI